MKDSFNSPKPTLNVLTVDIHNPHLKACSVVNKIIAILEKTAVVFLNIKV